MNVAFGTVIYEEGFDYSLEYIKSLNQQTYNDFDLLLLNDNLSKNKLDFITDNLKVTPKIYQGTNGLKPHELRVELIQIAKSKNYDIIIFGDFDDVFSEDRIASIMMEFNEDFGFFYNDLYSLEFNNKFFSELPDITQNIDSILESNYVGLSNSALNLNLVNQKIICDLNQCSNTIFDWYLYSLLLLLGLKGKKIKNGKTFYRLHSLNVAGKSENTLQDLMKEIEVKVRHYHSLSNKSIIFNEKLNNYQRLKHSIESFEINIMDYVDYDNDYWWGKLNLEKIGVE
ncbi:hypothetical protein HNQ94_003028 [Salirhabdus euzebyi]|uniref:Glycosyltransferase 2-like domain-containing protein n=1 Tax=Salirhabdus euzebyi TaxID=394506 RepID=A0A841Q7I9_9BACI|nr:glycosyltransferase [Salirhabdus euzebyi]MBB6454539.1 hypothetical protein [Salirhabdus euzebyi]